MEMAQGQTGGPRLAIYSQDGFGLGHMRRTSAIAWQVAQLRADASILTLSDSQLGQFFPVPPNYDYLKLPSIVKTGPGDWKASHLAISFPEVLEMRSQLIRSALLSYAPDVLLVDHMPHGAMGELIPALNALRTAGCPTRVALGLRDILDAPEVIQARWAVEGAYEVVERYYDRILVYGMQDVFDVAELYRFSGSLRSRVRYCGYVSPNEAPARAYETRREFLADARPGTRLIVVMAGGGKDGYPMMRAVLDALPLVQDGQPSRVLIITGPFLPPDQVADLQRHAPPETARILEAAPSTLDLVAAADLVISMAGYNSSVEILLSKTPALLVPRAGPSAEQRTRSRLFAARNWVAMLDPDQLTPQAVAAAILDTIRRPQAASNLHRPNLCGKVNAAEEILALLDPASAPAQEHKANENGKGYPLFQDCRLGEGVLR